MSSISLSGRASKFKALGRRSAPDLFSSASLLISLVVIAITAAAVYIVLKNLVWHDGRLDLSAARDAFKSVQLGTPLKNTAIAVGLSTVFAVIIGAVLAWINERTDARMGLFSDIAPLATFLMPPVAGCVGFSILFSPTAGYANRAWFWFLGLFGIHTHAPLLDAYHWTGLIAVFTVYGVPFTYMMIAPAMRMMDSSLEEASRIFGAGGLRTMFRVTLPGILPAVGAGAFLWIWIACSMVEIPLLLVSGSGIQLLAPQIINLFKFQYPPNLVGGVALSTIITLIVVIAWFVQSRILKAGHHAQVGAKGAKSAEFKLGRWRWVARLVMIFYAFCATVLPGLALLYVALRGTWSKTITLSGLSFARFKDLFTDAQMSKSLVNSLVLSTIAATLVILLAAVIALYVARSRNVLGRAVDLGVKIPGTIGGLIIVVGILLLFSGPPFSLAGSLTILLIAFVLLALPNASVAADAAVAGVGESLSEASRMSGAHEGRTFMRVVLPLLVPGLVGAWAAVFVRCMSDVTASAMLAGGSNPVMGFQILEQQQNGDTASMASLSIVLAVVSSVVVLASVWFGRWISRWTNSDAGAPTALAPSAPAQGE